MKTLVWKKTYPLSADLPVSVGDCVHYQPSDVTSAKEYRVDGWDAERGHVFLRRSDGSERGFTVFAAGILGMDWREPEPTPQYVIAAGYVASGLQFYGPFGDRDAAHAYADAQQFDAPYSVVLVEPPRPA